MQRYKFYYRQQNTAAKQIKGSLTILGIAILGGTLFNLFMPQGIGLFPSSIYSPNWRSVNLEQIITLHSQGALFVDTRDAAAYAQAHLRSAVTLPANELKQIYPLIKSTLEIAPILIVYGRSLSRFPAADVGQFLNDEGFKEIYVCSETLDSLEKIGLPVQRPQRKKIF